ncbi:MAG: copper resistance protein CopC [Dehalococcoidia bacterium]|nr:copper resistance protein CopC [Dehalococcoidia bacterium]
MKLLPVLAAPLLALAVVVSAAAHAEPVKVKPGDGAVLNERPTVIAFEMSQEMAREAGANDIDVFDADGNEVTAVAAVIDNANRTRLTVPLPADLLPGVYTVQWKTLSSEDGDPANGSIVFTYDPSATPADGKEVLREDLLGGNSGGSGATAALVIDVGGDSAGLTWMLVAAVGVGMFALGAGGTFLLVQKRP